MYCKKCGAALPSHGFICKNCGAIMNDSQIVKQKEYINDKKDEKEITFLSDRYSREQINRNFKENKKENKLLGVLFIGLVLIILVIIAILKVI